MNHIESEIEMARNCDLNSMNSIIFSSNTMRKSFINITNTTQNLKKNFSMIKIQNNMCSSMLSNKKPNLKTNNFKRIKQAISNKLKKFQLKRLIQTNDCLQSPNNAKLVKFNYKSYFAQPELVLPQPLELIEPKQCSESCSCINNSNGEESFRSYSSENDLDSDLFLMNSETSFAFKEIQSEDKCTTSTPNKKMNQTSYHDQSTQLQIETPVLIESTFNTSSCSHLSDDLIILQTAVCKAQSNNDLILNNRDIPNWAHGPQLNLAVVNQHYFKQEAASDIFC